MEGNRGLLYVRVMRTPSAVIYGPDYAFEFGRGHVLRESADDAAVIVSSGRGVHEALAAADVCARARRERRRRRHAVHRRGPAAGACASRASSSCLAEQNNGYILQNLLKVLYRRGDRPRQLDRILAINTLDADGRPRFIHSGTYEELIEAFGLTPAKIAARHRARVCRERTP